MADVRCPMCGKASSDDMEICQHCGARIKPLLASTAVDSQPIRAGERPVKMDAPEFDKIKPADNQPIRAGEAPTKKNTADLEPDLPTWLQSLRSNETAPGPDSTQEQASVEENPPSPPAAKGETPTDNLDDWLAGLDKAEKKEVGGSSDWLSDLRSSQATGSTFSPEPEAEENSSSDQVGWITQLGQDLRRTAAESHSQPPPGKIDLPAKASGTADQTEPGGTLLDWLGSRKPGASAQAGPPPEAGVDRAAPVSPVMGSSGFGSESPERPQPVPDSASQNQGLPREGKLPDWLSNFQSTPPEPAPSAPAEAFDRWNQPAAGATEAPAAASEAPNPPPPAPTGQQEWDRGEPIGPPQAGKLPDWLSKLGPQNRSENTSMPADSIRELPEQGIAPGIVPDWLSQLRGDVKTGGEAEAGKDSSEEAGSSGEQRNESSLPPERITGIERPAERTRSTLTPISEAKLTPRETVAPPDNSMATPDWLSKITPDQGAEAASEQAQGNIDAGELPSWVQAMRPVESVVSEGKASGQEEQPTEASGPLAGLRGVLPASPGLGMVRKPPAYSVKLQVSEGQQRNAADLERLIASESQPKAPAAVHLKASRIWRWAITLVLLLAVLVSLGMNLQAPTNSLPPSDGQATSRLIDAIPANAPILASFDYDPALSSELAAVAAPIFDQLLSKGVRLIVVSTSPTGPLLANQFLEDTNLVNIYQYSSKTDSHYLNLGYLAGGSAGIQYFAVSPRDAMLVDARGARIPADQSVLQGVQWLSDFRAVIILTDNADTGRGWVEQAGPHLGNTPIIMIASAQAEPMLRPYFDSGQVKGLVSGLVDAKAYEQIYARPGLANHYWGSLSLGTLAAELLIVLGTLGRLLRDPARGGGKNGKGT
jgi:hypothetical protein